MTSAHNNYLINTQLRKRPIVSSVQIFFNKVGDSSNGQYYYDGQNLKDFYAFCYVLFLK